MLHWNRMWHGRWWVKNARQHNWGSSAQTERIHFHGNDLQKAEVGGRLGPVLTSYCYSTCSDRERGRWDGILESEALLPSRTASSGPPSPEQWEVRRNHLLWKSESSALKILPALKCQSSMETDSKSFTSHSQGPLPPLTTCIILSKLLASFGPHL